MAHRGFTHSILFALIIAPVFAMLADRIHRPQAIAYKKWLLFFFLEVCVHLFIDGFNNYGTGWLEPFSHTRFSFNALYVVDPFFSLWPAIACLVLLALNRYSPRRTFWYRFGLFLPLIYLGYCSFHKVIINRDVKEMLTREGIPHEHYFTTPAPLQNWLWYVVSGNDSGYYVGFRSVFDSKMQIHFQYFPKRDSLLIPLEQEEDLIKLKRFSQGYYTVEKWNDTLVFNDLRFGQINGWQNPRGHFVFHYFLELPGSNKLVVQRGRFTGWNWKFIHLFFKRIEGD